MKTEFMPGLNKRLKLEKITDDTDDEEPLQWIRVDKPTLSESPRGSPKWGVDSLEPLELPQFTATVKKALRDGDSATVWNMVIT